MWSPKLDTRGNRNASYALIASAKPGDLVIHNSGGKISAISVVAEGCYGALQPVELRNGQAEYDWSNDGYRVDTGYCDFDVPLNNSGIGAWVINHPMADSCFDVNGRLKLRYLCNVAPGHAEYISKEALRLQKGTNVCEAICRALLSIGCRQL